MLAAFLTLLVLQDPPPRAAQAPTAEPDVSISVTATAREVRWRQTGAIRVRAWSEPAGPVIEESLATGLPGPIPAQVTFKNISWSLKAAASTRQETPPTPPTASPE